jgi:nucleotidyltransferase substrate binding protein (TIGR01987 family)
MDLGLKLKTARQALEMLKAIKKELFSIIVRDASIQRFEYTFEAIWKTLKVYLLQIEGIVCNSPKKCFREALKVGLLTPDQTQRFLEMTDDRNMTSHTYYEEIAQQIYAKIDAYIELMEILLERLEDAVNY